MTYLSVCSGIEAASVAWEPLGWKAIGFSEIEPFPCELLKQKFPNVKNYGDMTKYENWDIGQFDVLVGGTPCQSFSIAGKRGGTADERGALMYAYLGILETYRPRWIIWENVPGVLSSSKGYDFASFLTGLEQCGYGWCYRVLDAQYFGVPQRRRRVFVVGRADNRCDLAAKVLFEPESMCRDFKTGKEEKKEIAGAIGKSINYFRRGGNYKYHIDEKSSTLRCTAANDCFDLVLASGKQKTGTLLAQCGKHQWQNNQEAFSGDFFVVNGQRSLIRRLTPVECERLQGFPDNWTRISWRGKPSSQCPDTQRYKAIGNSMAVLVMRWIGKRIKNIEKSEIQK